MIGALGFGACVGPRRSADPEDARSLSAAARSETETWTGVRRVASDGSEEPLTVRITPVLGGAATLSELEVLGPRVSYLGLSLDTFDRERGVWLRTYVNATRGRPVTLVLAKPGEGAARAAAQIWRSSPGDDGRCSENRTEQLAPDRRRTTVSRSNDGGLTWTPLFVDELARVP